MNNKIILAGIFTVIALMSVVASGAVTKDIQFVNFIQADRPEQDVFIQTDKMDKVMRVEGIDMNDSAILSEMVYATASATHHDPFKVSNAPLGPFTKGKPLGFTLGEWLNGTGSGTYTVDGDLAEINFSFQNLVPDGTYTLWCSRVILPDEFVDLPCSSLNGSDNVLMVDSQGNGAININVKTLAESTQDTITLIALVYHSDGKTYGESPGDFGLNSHVQLLYMMPQSIETKLRSVPKPKLISTETETETETEPVGTPGFGGLFAMGILATLYFMRRKV